MARPNLDLMEWTGQVYADAPTAAAEIRIDAPPERVWGMVSDIFLMPQLSSELQEVTWLDGDPETAGRPSAAGSPAATPTRPWGSGRPSAR